MSLGSLNEDYRDVLLEFSDEGVEFLLVGAFAVAFHGVPRATGHMDVFVRASIENAKGVHAALVRFGAPLESACVAPADFEQPGMVYQMGLPPRRIDVLTEISGITFDEAWGSRDSAELEGRMIAIIGREDLLRNKEASGRPKDVADGSRLRRHK